LPVHRRHLWNPVLAAFSPTVPARAGPRAGYFPDFILRTHENKPVRFYTDLVQGRVVIFNMMYAECEGICPRMTANLAQVQRALGDRVGRDIFMYSLSLRPRQDTPGALAHYARMHGIKPGWQFLTGKPREVDILRRKLGFFDSDPAVDRDLSQHTGLVRFGNESLDRWAACPALADPAQIVRSVLWVDHNRK